MRIPTLIRGDRFTGRITKVALLPIEKTPNGDLIKRDNTPRSSLPTHTEDVWLLSGQELPIFLKKKKEEV